MINKLKLFFSKNWKTTIGGLLVLIIWILQSSEVITAEVAQALTAILVAFGFIAAKDGDKTGA